MPPDPWHVDCASHNTKNSVKYKLQPQPDHTTLGGYGPTWVANICIYCVHLKWIYDLK